MSDLFKKPNLPSAIKKTGHQANKPDKQSQDLINKYKTKQSVSRLMCMSDATGSMQPHWDSTKKILVELINRISKMGSFEINWVAYRDYDTTVIEQSGWHSKADPLNRFINGIQCMGGGDFEEAVERALQLAAEDQNATRIILIGDAPPHKQGDYVHQAMKLARLQRPVYSFVVGSDLDTIEAFKKISDLTGGVSTKLTSADDILDLIAITVADEIGGKDSVQKYLQDYQKVKGLSSGTQNYAQKLLDKGK